MVLADLAKYLATGIHPDIVAAAARQQQDRLGAIEPQRDDIERMRAEVKAQARALDQAA